MWDSYCTWILFQPAVLLVHNSKKDTEGFFSLIMELNTVDIILPKEIKGGDGVGNTNIFDYLSDNYTL